MYMKTRQLQVLSIMLFPQSESYGSSSLSEEHYSSSLSESMVVLRRGINMEVFRRPRSVTVPRHQRSTPIRCQYQELTNAARTAVLLD